MSQTERLYWLDDQIRNGRHPNAATLAQQFPVSERTAYADVRHLKGALNAPLVFDTARGGYVYTDPTYRLPFLLLTDGETAALRRSLLLAREYAPAAERRVFPATGCFKKGLAFTLTIMVQCSHSS